MLFDIDSIKKLIEENKLIERELENRRMILLNAVTRNLIPKPSFVKSNFFYFFNKKITYFCPICNTELNKTLFSFLCIDQKHYHLLCQNKECKYEYVTT